MIGTLEKDKIYDSMEVAKMSSKKRKRVERERT
jgi:hypothetical protein